MKISVDGSEAATTDGRPARVTLTIDITSDTDDPRGYLWGLAVRGDLAQVLRMYGQGRHITPQGPADVWDMLTAAGRVGARIEQVIGDVAWLARDTYGRSWGEISLALDRPQPTVRRLVERIRTEYADLGYWRDAGGLHKADTPEEARRRAMARIDELAARRTRPADE
ncbi:hypothetical protein ABZ801_41395 [Actinomadura sp. NPDC047616]|uniref:hypothetical protein n=1 Tax=Actinomadura sp. NPDC047616 TaxID=3155914 RepID=UPI0033C0E9F0